jgi:hypothetical protein
MCGTCLNLDEPGSWSFCFYACSCAFVLMGWGLSLCFHILFGGFSLYLFGFWLGGLGPGFRAFCDVTR